MEDGRYKVTDETKFQARLQAFMEEDASVEFERIPMVMIEQLRLPAGQMAKILFLMGPEEDAKDPILTA